VAAFTIIELLAVIAAIVLLVALLLPALSRVRQRTMAIQCQSQLRQIGVAQQAYPTDHRDWLVPVTIYGANHAPYGLTWDAGQAEWSRILRWTGYINDGVTPTSRSVRGIMRCQQTLESGGSYSYTSSYGMNGAIGGYMRFWPTQPMTVDSMMWYLPGAAWRRMRRLQNPAATYLIADVVNDLPAPFGPPSSDNAPAAALPYYGAWWMHGRSDLGECVPWMVHDNQANMLFADGHTRALREPELVYSVTFHLRLEWIGVK
jgi:prepilin-type processing-associated H-X9-DG protein